MNFEDEVITESDEMEERTPICKIKVKMCNSNLLHIIFNYFLRYLTFP